jgi:bifunctional enzyme CysN/CysC
MDLVGRDRQVFERISAEYLQFLANVGVQPAYVIPVSGFHGENVAARAESMPWYEGPTVLEALDRFTAPEPPIEQPFRMPVQGVYKFTAQSDERRIVAGTVETGCLRVGDEVVFYPSGKRSRVRTIEAFNRPTTYEARAGEATGFTLEEQIYVTRGEIAVRLGEPPPLVSTRLRVNLFWLGRAPLVSRKDYALKLGTARVPARLEAIHRVIDAAELASSEGGDRVERHDVAECTMVLGRPLAFDTAADFERTGRFVIVDDTDISGGGIVREALADNQTQIRDAVLRRNLKWAASGVSEERRAERLSQRPTLLLITGQQDADRKGLARELESRLFDDGRFVYFLAIGNVLYGVDADLDHSAASRAEHVRRLGEVANILLDAGLIVIATAVALTTPELELLRTAVGRERVAAVWLGENAANDFAADLVLHQEESADERTARLKALLQQMGAIFRLS